MSTDTPEEWRSVTLGELASPEPYSCVGGPFGSDLTSKDYVAEPGVPVIRGGNVPEDGPRFNDHGFVFVSNEKADLLRKNMAYTGDLIFTQRGTLGQIGQIPSDARFQRYVVSQSQMKLRPNLAKVDPDYLYQYFRSPIGKKKVLDSAIATGVPHINLGILKGFALSLPPMREQQRIAKILASVDVAIQATQALIEQTQKVRQGLQTDLLAPCALTTIDRLEPPRGWRLVRLGEVFTERTEPGECGLPVLTVTMHDGIKRRDELDRRVVSELKPHQHLRVRPGDIAYNMMRMWQGASGLVDEDGMISPAYVVATPKASILREFAAELLKNPSMIRLLHGYSQGVTGDRLRLYYEHFATIPIALPPLDQQRRSVETLSPFGEVVRLNHERMASLRKVKAEMMADLLTGRKRVAL